MLRHHPLFRPLAVQGGRGERDHSPTPPPPKEGEKSGIKYRICEIFQGFRDQPRGQNKMDSLQLLGHDRRDTSAPGSIAGRRGGIERGSIETMPYPPPTNSCSPKCFYQACPE